MPDESFAFPQERGGGMTLREYFAAKAMQGLLSGNGYHKPEDAAKSAVNYADALIEALKT